MMDNCFLLPGSTDHGGNIPPRQRVTVQRRLAIGDAVAASVVAEKIMQAGLDVTYLTDPAIVPVLRLHPRLSVGETNAARRPQVNLDGAYEKHPERGTRHFSDLFLAAARPQLESFGVKLGPPRNCRPELRVPEAQTQEVRARLAEHPRPWIFVCPRSQSWLARTVPDCRWLDFARHAQGTKFWLGLYPAPAGFVDLRCRRIDALAPLLSAADIMVSVDTGPMHIAAALGIPVVVIEQASSPNLHLPDQRDFEVFSAGLDCLNCQEHYCPIKPFEPPCGEINGAELADVVNRRGMSLTSAVIPVYRPDPLRLKRCLDAVLPQVDEVVLAAEGNSIVPPLPPKVRLVRKKESGIGFGRNVNHGLRHTRGELVLILNDDVYLAHDAVARLKECMKDGVGLTGHLLHYPNGRIYHGGVARSNGALDWGHIDHNRFEHTITDVREMEQVTGASILVRREAFYQAGGFDERFFMYCEDNDLCMKIRQQGWKVFYTPHARGIHEGSASARDVPRINEHMRESQRLFHEKWDWWLKKNRNVALGTF